MTTLNVQQKSRKIYSKQTILHLHKNMYLLSADKCTGYDVYMYTYAFKDVDLG